MPENNCQSVLKVDLVRRVITSPDFSVKWLLFLIFRWIALACSNTVTRNCFAVFCSSAAGIHYPHAHDDYPSPFPLITTSLTSRIVLGVYSYAQLTGSRHFKFRSPLTNSSRVLFCSIPTLNKAIIYPARTFEWSRFTFAHCLQAASEFHLDFCLHYLDNT